MQQKRSCLLSYAEIFIILSAYNPSYSLIHFEAYFSNPKSCFEAEF